MGNVGLSALSSRVHASERRMHFLTQFIADGSRPSICEQGLPDMLGVCATWRIFTDTDVRASAGRALRIVCFCQNSRPHLPVPARPDADCSFLTLIRTQLAAEEEELRSLFMTKEQLVTYAEMLHQAHQGYTCPLFLSVWRYFVLRDRRFCVLFQCKHA